eukprot:2730112-Rhodomonas_salina.1
MEQTLHVGMVSLTHFWPAEIRGGRRVERLAAKLKMVATTHPNILVPSLVLPLAAGQSSSEVTVQRQCYGSLGSQKNHVLADPTTEMFAASRKLESNAKRTDRGEANTDSS